MIIHTTKSAAEYLQRRYAITVQSATVQQWCKRGKIPGAYRIGEGRRSTWQIPENDIDTMVAKSQNRAQAHKGKTKGSAE